MLISEVFRFTRVLLVSLLSLLVVGFNHTAAINSSSMPDMVGRQAANNAQCETSCVSALPANKQDELNQIERDDESPEPALFILTPAALSLVALTFVVKLLPSLSSWRPPDFLRLYGQRLFYA